MIQPRRESPLRTLWLMGAKTRIIPDFIDGAVRDLVDPGATVLDLCAGTSAVGRSLADRYRIIANDVQGFAATLARAHLVGGGKWAAALDHLEPEADLERAFEANMEALRPFLGGALTREDQLLPKVVEEFKEHRTDGAVAEYRQLLDSSPGPGDPGRGAGSLYESVIPLYSGFLTERRRQPDLLPYGLCTLYFQNSYFSLRQSMVIDSFRAAIARIPAADPFRSEKQNLYLAALLYGASVSTSGTSHFAQPRSVRKDSELQSVAKRRCIDIEFEFHRALSEIRMEWGNRPKVLPHHVYQLPAEDLLAADGPLQGERIDLVYLDPPYTADNYSRFYHVLETLVNYDYPEFELRAGQPTRGLYPIREARYTSGFCRRTEVESVFRTVAERVSALGARLLVSYCQDSGLLLKHWLKDGEENPRARFHALFRDTFGSVEIRDRRLMHSGQGDSNLQSTELLVLCEP